MKQMWPWQDRGVNQTLSLLSSGQLSVCVTAPTGMGKGRMIEELALPFLRLDGKAMLLSNRRMLTAQAGQRFHDAGIQFGFLSAEHGIDTSKPMTIASVQTLSSRIARAVMEMPRVDEILVDECHNGAFDKIIQAYRKTHEGTAIVGFTATPIGLRGKYDHLVIAGTKREGRQHGALVTCRVFAPSEPDMRGVRMTKVGEYEHKGMVKRAMECTVFADVFDAWERHGGYARPTLLWAPGVPESRWFVKEFRERGITAEHIDGKTTETERLRIRESCQSGATRVVSSFGVLREGVDWPFISYGILVQVCGAIGTYLQVVGRILRSSNGKQDAILQDHSGAWWRHGSPNDDVSWTLDDTAKSLEERRRNELAGKPGDSREESPEGICCPQCGGLRKIGPQCPHCGFEHTSSVRRVKMEDGSLVEMTGRVHTPPKKPPSEEQKLWTKCLFSTAYRGGSIVQARAMYKSQAGAYPNDACKPMPESDQWPKRITEVYSGFARRA